MLEIPNWKNTQSYFIDGKTEAKDSLLDFLRKENIDVSSKNPDFLIFESEKQFSISEVREFIDRHSIRKIGNSPRIFILRFDFITIEAQNSLLKIIEEPSKDNYIFIISNSSHLFLPTIKSRLREISFSGKIENKYLTRAEEFFNVGKKKRLEMVSKLIGDIDDENISKGDLKEFVEALEIVITKKFKKNKNLMKSVQAIHLAEKYVSFRSPSRKMIMEYLAIMI